MSSNPEEMPNSVGSRLNTLLARAGLASISASQGIKFQAYLALLLRWNESVSLTSIRTEQEILERHFVESIACAQALPADIKTLLDFGSGAGFPGLPISLWRPEIAVTLAESQVKKAAFLHEAVRALGVSAKVYSQRAELLREHFDCVTMRAVDRMAEAMETALRLVAPGGRLALMTTKSDVPRLEAVAGAAYSWGKSMTLPNSDDRVLVIGKRRSSSAG